MPVVRLEDIRIFVATADGGSLSAAARALDLTPAVASVSVKRLEKELSTRLLVRSTRSLRLTPDGERYLLHALTAFAALSAGQHAIADGLQTIGGNVSISMPSDLGRNLLFRWIDDFQTRYSKVTLNIRLGDRITDLYRQPVDLAVRYGEPEDSTLIAIPLTRDNRRVLCASPEYFARHGRPRVPTDLTQHNCLRYALADSLHQHWTFAGIGTDAGDQTSVTVKVEGDRISDDAELVHRWALAGYGIAYKSRLDVLASLRSGTLEAALTGFQGEPAPLRLICTHRLLISPTVIALRDFLQQRIDQHLSAD